MQAGTLFIKRAAAAILVIAFYIVTMPDCRAQADQCVTLKKDDSNINGFLRADGSFIDCNSGTVYTKEQIKGLRILESNCICTCNISSLPSVTFKAGSAKLSQEAMGILEGAVHVINGSPGCHVKVSGYVPDAVNKASQQLSWDRVNAVIKYLVEKEGISEGRLIFSYDNQGGGNSVDLQPTTETGVHTVNAPFPQYRQKQ